MKELAKEITFTVSGKVYKIEYPTVAAFMEIESGKMSLSAGKYREMMVSGTKTSAVALDLIDMAATLRVITPELLKDLKTKSILDLDLRDSSAILKAYKEQIEQWMEGWLSAFQGISLEKPAKPNGGESK